MTVLLGLLLGVLSRVEEVTAGFSAGLSSDAMWVSAAFVAGLRQREAGRGAVAGALALTVANASYYATVALEDPGVDLANVAGRPAGWIVLGLAGGAMFGAAGSAWRHGRPETRAGASLLLASVLIADGAVGPPAHRISLVLGVALAMASAPGRLRAPVAATALALAAIASTGALEPVLP